MTPEEQKSIHDIQGTGGFRVIESIVKKHIAELGDISNLDETLQVSIESQALGRKYGKKKLEDILSELGIYQKPVREIKKTYE